jgi:hypothetical protein
LCCLITVAKGQTHSDEEQLTFGINSKIARGDNYKVDLSDQLNFLKKSKIFRFKINLNAKGIADNENDFKFLLKKLDKMQIIALPVIELQKSNAKFLSDFYTLNYTLGRNFYYRYGDYLSVAELGNNFCDKIFLTDSLENLTDSNYNSSTTQQLMATLVGFIDGIRSLDTNFNIAISLNDNRYALLDILKKFQVNYDIIAYQWKNPERDLSDTTKNYWADLSFIQNQYQKSLWITEFNLSQSETIEKLISQRHLLSAILKKIVSQGIATGFFVNYYDDINVYKSLNADLNIKPGNTPKNSNILSTN